jgi:hypothetical protein
MGQTAAKLTERIPEPEEVREQLAENLKEGRLLRQMLKLAEARRRVAMSNSRPAAGLGATR